MLLSALLLPTSATNTAELVTAEMLDQQPPTLLTKEVN